MNAGPAAISVRIKSGAGADADRGNRLRAGSSAASCAAGTSGRDGRACVCRVAVRGENAGDPQIFHYLATARGELFGCRSARWLLGSLKFPFAPSCDLLFDLWTPPKIAEFSFQNSGDRSGGVARPSGAGAGPRAGRGASGPPVGAGAGGESGVTRVRFVGCRSFSGLLHHRSSPLKTVIQDVSKSVFIFIDPSNIFHYPTRNHNK